MDFSSIQNAISAMVSEQVFQTKKNVAQELLDFVSVTERLTPEEKFPVQMILEEWQKSIKKEDVVVLAPSDPAAAAAAAAAKKKVKRMHVASKYNLWIKETVAKMKVERPDIPGSARLMMAARMYREEKEQNKATGAESASASMPASAPAPAPAPEQDVELVRDD
jgi:hypothetical protein